MKTKRLLLAMLLLIVGVFNTTGSFVGADASKHSEVELLAGIYQEIINSDNPELAFAGLPQETQKAMIEAMSHLTYETVVNSDNLRDSLGITVEVNARSLFGTIVWRFRQRIEWSYDGFYVTDVSDHHSWGTAVWPWFYRDLIGEAEYGGAGNTYFTRFSQGLFEEIIGDVLIDSDTPWIDMTVFGDGTDVWSADQG